MKRKKREVPAGRIYGGESATERLARQRQQFMAAGLELFGSVGYRATSVRALCKQAELIDRYFYKNFRDTEDLLAAVYTESLDQIQADILRAITPVLATGDAARVVETALDAFFKAFENSRVARVCWLEVLGVSPRIDAMYTRRIEQFAELLQTLARQVLPQWPQSDEEARVTAIALIGAVSQSAQFWLLSGYKAERKVLVSATGVLMRGTVAALAQADSHASTPKRQRSRRAA